MRTAALACVLAGGCIVWPRTETTRDVVSNEDTVVAEPAGMMHVELATANRQIAIHAVATRTCRRETWQTIEVREETHATFGIADTGGSGGADAIVWLLVAPISLAVTSMITLVVVSSSKDKITREKRKRFVSYRDCSIPGANLKVTLTLPSGVGVELFTGDDGRAYFDVPENETDDGVVDVQVGTLAAQRVHYCKTCVWPPPTVVADKRPPPKGDREACLRARSDRMRAAQRVADLKERQRLLLALPVCD